MQNNNIVLYYYDYFKTEIGIIHFGVYYIKIINNNNMLLYLNVPIYR